MERIDAICESRDSVPAIERESLFKKDSDPFMYEHEQTSIKVMTTKNRFIDYWSDIRGETFKNESDKLIQFVFFIS